MFEQDAWLHLVPSAETPQQGLKSQSIKEQSTYTQRGLMDYGSLGCRALSAGLADWTETPCRPRGEPEGWVNTKLMERAPLWDRLTSSRAQLRGDVEPSRWPSSGEPPRSLKAWAWPFDQCWNHRLKTLDTASCCVSHSSGNQSECGWKTAVFISKSFCTATEKMSRWIKVWSIRIDHINADLLQVPQTY